MFSVSYNKNNEFVSWMVIVSCGKLCNIIVSFVIVVIVYMLMLVVWVSLVLILVWVELCSVWWVIIVRLVFGVMVFSVYMLIKSS